MKLELLALGSATAIVVCALACDRDARAEELPEIAIDQGRSSDSSVGSLAPAPMLEPPRDVARTVVPIADDGRRRPSAASREGSGSIRPTRPAWDWQKTWKSRRCLEDPDMNPWDKSFDPVAVQDLDALLAPLNQDVREKQKAFQEESRACMKRQVEAGVCAFARRGEQVPVDPRALDTSVKSLGDGWKRHVQILPNEYPALDEAYARREASQATRREQVRLWIRAH